MQKNIISQNKNISINDKPMTQKDKMALANYIRCLPEDQLKGIINLLDKNSEVEIKKGYYELDIEKLSDHKLRELEKYVKSCMKSSKNFIPLRYQDEFNQKKKFEKEKNKENSIDNSNNKQNNINEEKQNEKNDDNIIKYIKYNNEYKQNNLKDDLFLEEITLRENDQKKNSSLKC